MEGTSHYTATVYLGNRSAIYLADLGARSAIYKHYRLAACLADYGLSQYRCVRSQAVAVRRHKGTGNIPGVCDSLLDVAGFG